MRNRAQVRPGIPTLQNLIPRALPLTKCIRQVLGQIGIDRTLRPRVVEIHESLRNSGSRRFRASLAGVNHERYGVFVLDISQPPDRSGLDRIVRGQEALAEAAGCP